MSEQPTEAGWYTYSGGAQTMVFHLRTEPRRQWSAHFVGGACGDCEWGYIEQALGVWNLVPLFGRGGGGKVLATGVHDRLCMVWSEGPCDCERVEAIREDEVKVMEHIRVIDEDVIRDEYEDVAARLVRVIVQQEAEKQAWKRIALVAQNDLDDMAAVAADRYDTLVGFRERLKWLRDAALEAYTNQPHKSHLGMRAAVYAEVLHMLDGMLPRPNYAGD